MVIAIILEARDLLTPESLHGSFSCFIQTFTKASGHGRGRKGVGGGG